MQLSKKRKIFKNPSKKGYTIMEVMLALGISSMMMIGLFVSTFVAISSQRYNDSLRGFAEYMRNIYSEVISPESYADAGRIGTGGNNQAILGKLVTFGYNNDTRTVRSVTLVGSTDINRVSNQDFITEMMDLEATQLSMYCGSVQTYNTLWEAELVQANGQPSSARYDEPFVGTLIIARTPSSSRIHTIFARGHAYDLGNCDAADTRFHQDIRDSTAMGTSLFTIGEAIGICIKSENTSIPREVRIAADGSNTSAVWMRDADPEEDSFGGGSACRM